MRTSLVSSLRAAVAVRRAERREQARLVQELASFDTPRQRLELDAILERHTAEQTREIREILARMAARAPALPSGGPLGRCDALVHGVNDGRNQFAARSGGAVIVIRMFVRKGPTDVKFGAYPLHPAGRSELASS